MSLTPPNHARALFLALFYTWLYVAMVVAWHMVTRTPLDVLSLAGGSLSVGALVYGVTVIHRAFWANLLPFSYNVGSSLWAMPTAVGWAFSIIGGLIIFVSLILILWAWYHAHRDELTIESSLPVALLLGTPLVVYELLRHLFGIEIFGTLITGLFRLL